MSLRILTANLYNGRARPSAVAEVLNAVEPHVVAVQELSENAAEVLADWGQSRLLDPRDDTTGMGLAVDADATFERLEFPNCDPVRATFDGSRWGLGLVEVLCTHLANPVSRPWRRSRRLRTAELSALEHLLAAPGETRVVVGDFNSSPVWPLYRRVIGLATDAASEAGTTAATWSFFPWSPAVLRIDHAFIQGARSLETRAVKIAGSDHRGLVVELGATRS